MQSWIVGGRQCLEGTFIALLNLNHEFLVHAPTSLWPPALWPPEGTESHPVLYRV